MGGRRIGRVSDFTSRVSFRVNSFGNNEQDAIELLLPALQDAFTHYLSGSGHPLHLSGVVDLVGIEQYERDNADPLYRMRRVALVLTGHSILPPYDSPIKVRRKNFHLLLQHIEFRNSIANSLAPTR